MRFLRFSLACLLAFLAAPVPAAKQVADGLKGGMERERPSMDGEIPPYLRVPRQLEEGSQLDLVPRLPWQLRSHGPFQQLLRQLDLRPRPQRQKTWHFQVPESLERGSQLDTVPYWSPRWKLERR